VSPAGFDRGKDALLARSFLWELGAPAYEFHLRDSERSAYPSAVSFESRALSRKAASGRLITTCPKWFISFQTALKAGFQPIQIFYRIPPSGI
jgi:hypothetical protein